MTSDRLRELRVIPFPTEREIAANSRSTAKSWETVAVLIGFPEEVRGLTILDIGGGGSDATASLLERGADAYAIDTKYASIPDLKGSIRKLHKERRGGSRDGSVHGALAQNSEAEVTLNRQIISMKANRDRYRAAYATQLPFPDDYFDLVFSLSCVLSHLDENFDVLMDAVREAMRVTRPGGQIQLAPFAFFAEEPSVTGLRTANQTRLIEWLRRQGNLHWAIEETAVGSEVVRLVINKI